MNFAQFFRSLSEDEQESLAAAAGTTRNYIKTHLIAPAARRRIPNKPLMDALATACERAQAPFSRSELLEFFYEPAGVQPSTEERVA